MMMDCSKGKLLEGLESVFQHVFVPSLDACEVRTHLSQIYHTSVNKPPGAYLQN